MDNAASGAVMDWFEKHKVDAQKVASYNHQATILTIAKNIRNSTTVTENEIIKRKVNSTRWDI